MAYHKSGNVNRTEKSTGRVARNGNGSENETAAAAAAAVARPTETEISNEREKEKEKEEMNERERDTEKEKEKEKEYDRNRQSRSARNERNEESDGGSISSSSSSVASGQDEGEWSVVPKGNRKRSPKTYQTVTPIRVHKSNVKNPSGFKQAAPRFDSGSDFEMDFSDGDQGEEIQEIVDENEMDDRDIPRSLGADSIFVTDKPKGPMRDVLTVECSKLNDEEFKGTVTYTEAKEKIFMEALGLNADLLHSLKFGFSKCRTVTFKLKHQINVDELLRVSSFSIWRNYWSGDTETSDELHCRLLGVRAPKVVPDPRIPM